MKLRNRDYLAPPISPSLTPIPAVDPTIPDSNVHLVKPKEEEGIGEAQEGQNASLELEGAEEEMKVDLKEEGEGVEAAVEDGDMDWSAAGPSSAPAPAPASGKGKGKRKRDTDKEKEKEKAPKKKKEKLVVRKPDGSWLDLPNWSGKEKVCYFFQMPGEIMDMILASPILTIVDHLSLAASCRPLRACYYPSEDDQSFLWDALDALRPMDHADDWADDDDDDYPNLKGYVALVRHLWTGRKVDPTTMEIVKNVPGGVGPGGVVRTEHWEAVIKTVNTLRITKSTAKSRYKINDSQLYTIRCILANNPRYKSADPMQLYREAAVQSVAFAWHSGYVGHLAWIKKREEAAAKAAATRAKNGTTTRRRQVEYDSEGEEISDDYGSYRYYYSGRYHGCS